MRLTVVGCSGSLPGPDSAASCYLLEAPYGDRVFRLVLDLGSGAIGALQRHADLRSIDAVALTHLHPDHCLDMCGFHVVRRYHPTGHLGRIPVFGPPGTAERLAQAYGMAVTPGMSAEFDIREYDGAELEIGPFTVETAVVDHPVDTYALRVSHGGHSIVYSGDTGPCDALTQLAKGSDVLLAEASFLEGANNPAHLHMSGRDAATTATAAGVGHLVLTHIPPWHDRAAVLAEARPHFDGPVTLARSGLRLEP
ncbi:MAG: MBL fold metallo-hydrolase [Nocardioidaceae bacterium]